jgi:hypothetical protein
MCSCLFLLPAFFDHLFPSSSERLSRLLTKLFAKSAGKPSWKASASWERKRNLWPGQKRPKACPDNNDEYRQLAKPGGHEESEVALGRYPRGVESSSNGSLKVGLHEP